MYSMRWIQIWSLVSRHHPQTLQKSRKIAGKGKNIINESQTLKQCFLHWIKCSHIFVKVKFESKGCWAPITQTFCENSKILKKKLKINVYQKIVNKCNKYELLRNKFCWLELGFLCYCSYIFISCSELFPLRITSAASDSFPCLVFNINLSC